MRRSFTCLIMVGAVLWAMAMATDPGLEWILFAVMFPLLWGCLAWSGARFAERRTELREGAGGA